MSGHQSRYNNCIIRIMLHSKANFTATFFSGMANLRILTSKGKQKSTKNRINAVYIHSKAYMIQYCVDIHSFSSEAILAVTLIVV